MQPPTAPKLPTPTARCAQAYPAAPHNSQAMPRASLGRHSWDWAEKTERWGAVSCCVPHIRHIVSSTVARWDDMCARIVIVGTLSMRCADMCRCWSLSN